MLISFDLPTYLPTYFPTLPTYLAVLWLGGDTKEEISESIAVSDGSALLVAQSDSFGGEAT